MSNITIELTHSFLLTCYDLSSLLCLLDNCNKLFTFL